jgi:hypothetical protein
MCSSLVFAKETKFPKYFSVVVREVSPFSQWVSGFRTAVAAFRCISPEPGKEIAVVSIKTDTTLPPFLPSWKFLRLFLWLVPRGTEVSSRLQ